jgi:hypothetical protein
MDETIEQISLTCANQLLATILDGLDQPVRLAGG